MKIVDLMSFTKLYDKIKHNKMPLSLAYRLNKMALRAKEEGEFIAEQMKLIGELYGDFDEKGELRRDEFGNILIREACLDECNSKIAELNSLETLDFDFHFTLEELECLGLTPEDLLCFMPLIQEKPQD